MSREYKLSSFFICVFVFVGCIASFWYFHRRTNSYAHLNENGIDKMAPTYQTEEGKKMDETFRKSRMKSESAPAEMPSAMDDKKPEEKNQSK